MNSMTTIEKLKDVEKTKGTKAKYKKVISYLDDQDFVSVVRYLLDKNKTSGIKKAKLSKLVNPTIYELHIVSSFTSFLDYITVNNNGNDTNVYITQAFCAGTEDSEFTGKIITKSLKLGIGLKVLNELPQFSDILSCQAMLAESYFDFPAHVEGKDIILTEKLDGNRCLAIVDESATLLSRENKIIQGFESIEDVLKEHFKGYVLDGELIAYNDEKDSSEMFKDTQTVIRKKADGKVGLKYLLFDILTLEEYSSETRTTSCIERKQLLHELVPESDLIKEVPILYYGPYDEEIVKTHLDMMLKKGAEGLMMNIAGAVYQSRRTRDLLKLKIMKDVDLKVTGFQEGTNKYEGTLGALFVDYKGFPVKVGSGFKDDERNEIWNNQDEYLGKIVRVQYFEESTDAKGNLSLRFPVFIDFRDDKTEPSYN